jgi:hypothetical protein
VPNFHRVFSNGDVLALTIGYTATIWGTAGLRQWIVVFLTFCAMNQGGSAAEGWSMLIAGALVGLLGVPAGLYGNELSLRLGLRITAMGVFLAVSAGERIVRLSRRKEVRQWPCILASASPEGSPARCCLACLLIGSAERHGWRRGWWHSVSARLPA